MNSNLLTALTLWKREIVRFYRQPARVAGAVGSPLIFWIFIGGGMGRSFASAASEDLGYSQYFYSGTLLLIVLFTAIFSMISLIQDRTQGFLQSVLVAPVSRFSIVLGKVLGGTTLAFIQAVIFLALAPLVGIPLTLNAFLGAAGVLLLNAFVLSALGFLIAWPFNSIQGFHAVMNLLLLPLWLLSGALFPAEGAAGWIQFIMKFNPLSYGLLALQSFLFQGLGVTEQRVPLSCSLATLAAFGLVMFVLASLLTARQSERNVV